MVVDDAFGIAGGAGGVVERDRVPLVRRVLPFEVRVAAGDELLVVALAESLAAGAERVDDIDDLDLALDDARVRLRRSAQTRCR